LLAGGNVCGGRCGAGCSDDVRDPPHKFIGDALEGGHHGKDATTRPPAAIDFIDGNGQIICGSEYRATKLKDFNSDHLGTFFVSEAPTEDIKLAG
jgi:hypothetical protein